jgi:phosphoesterase RecJ-like protein
MQMAALRFPPPEEFLTALRAAPSLVLMTHRGPDGDGLGCELALARSFEAVGREVSILNEDPIPPRFRFLDPGGRVKVFRRSHTKAVRDAALGLLVDTSEPLRAGTAAGLRQKSGGPFLAMDHHPPSAESLAGFIEPRAASTAELAYDLLRALELPIDAVSASALYAGIAFDTNSFRFIRNEAGPLRVAAELVERGADAERIQAELSGHPPDYARLLGRLLPTITFAAGGRVAVLALTVEHLEGLEIDADDLSEVVTFLNRLRGVDACAFVRQNGKSDWRINLRCREGFAIDELARTLGGGGHSRAAGATARGVPLDEVTARVAKELEAIVTGASPPAP